MPWQPSPTIFPDVEYTLCLKLRDAFGSDAYVGNKVPAQRRDRMVIINRDGGGNDGLTDRARVRVRVWESKMRAANELAVAVQQAFPALVDGNPVVRAENPSGPTEVPDESTQPLLLLGFVVHTRSLTAKEIALGTWRLGIDHLGGSA